LIQGIAYLVLDVRPITTLVNLDSQIILWRVEFQMWRNIEFTGVSGTLGVTDFLTIQPYREGRINTFKPQSPLAAIFQVVRHGKGGDVAAALVVIVRNMWRIYGKWEVHVGVLGTFSKALTLPGWFWR
jgi:hypothetical protein